MVQAETGALKKENSELKANNSKLEEENKKVFAEKKALQRDRDQLKEEVSREKDEKNALIKARDHLEEEIKRGKDSSIALTSDLVGMKDEILSVTSDLQKAIAENLILQDTARKENDEKTALKKDLNAEKAAKGNLEEKVIDLSSTIRILEDALQREKDANNNRGGTEEKSLKKTLADLKAENAALKDELRNEKVDRTGFKETLDEIENEMASLHKKNKELTEDLESWEYEVLDLQEQLEQEKKGNHVLEKEVTDLKSKLEQCCSEGGHDSATKETWMSKFAVPSNWVPFEDLRAREFSRTGKPLTIVKTVPGLPALSEDDSTNIRASYLYRAMLRNRVYQIAVVNVEELIPSKEKARFDPNIWS